MANSVNYGNQTILFDYLNLATSKSFNKVNYKLTEPGIYEGGTLTKVDADTISISPLVCYITDSSNDIGVRVQTSETIYIDVAEATPYIALRMEWVNQDGNYMEVVAVSYNNLQSEDLIIGRCVYDSGVLQADFDYTRRDNSVIDSIITNRDAFNVSPTEPVSNQVYVVGGTLGTQSDQVTVSSGSYPTGGLSSTTLGRIDLLYIDDNDGLIKAIEGADASTPVKPDYANKFVIAEIHRGASRSTIYGSEIIQIDPDLRLIAGTGINDWKESVLDQVDFTSAEPGSPSSGDRYINTGTGSSSGTSQAVTANYIYEWNGTNWTEDAPNEGATVRVEDEDRIYIFDGSSWGLIETSLYHNDMLSKQGGTTDEYYHLTSSQHTYLTDGNFIKYWDSTVTYNADEVVAHNGIWYKSLVGSNLNKNPLTESAYWEVMAGDAVIERHSFAEAVAQYKVVAARNDADYELHNDQDNEFFGDTSYSNIVDDYDDLTTTNWTKNNTTVSQETEEVLGHYKLNKITNTSATTPYVQQDQTTPFSTTGSKPFSFVVRQGSDAQTDIEFISTTGTEAKVSIDWSSLTFTYSSSLEGVETKLDEQETYLIEMLSDSFSSSDNLTIKISGTDNNGTVYVSAFFTADIDDGVPRITEETIGATSITTTHTLNSLLSFRVTFYPTFDNTDTNDHVIFAWYNDSTHYLKFYYRGESDNAWYLEWRDGGAARTLGGVSYGGNALTKYVVSGQIDFGESLTPSLTINGSTDTTWSGAIDSLSSSFTSLRVGHLNSSDYANSRIISFKVWDDYDGVTDDGKAILADCGDEDQVEVLGIVLEDTVAGSSYKVQKSGTLEGFSGLLTGYPCFLGHHGFIEQNPYNIEENEYRVFLGEAISDDTLNINIHEATLNSPVSEVVSALYPLVYLKDASWTMTNSDLSKTTVTVQYDLSSSGSVTLTLPSASSLNTGSSVYVQVVDDNDDVTIDNHGLGYTLKLEGKIGSYAHLQSDGLIWQLLGYLDSGSNSDGEWKKFQDGSTIQTIISTANSSTTITLPYTEANTDYSLTGNLANTSSTKEDNFVIFYSKTTTNFGFYSINYSGTEDNSGTKNFTINGRWRA